MHLPFGGTVGLIDQCNGCEHRLAGHSATVRVQIRSTEETVGAGSDLRRLAGRRRGGPRCRRLPVERSPAPHVALIKLPTAWRTVFQAYRSAGRVVYCQTYGTAGKGVYCVEGFFTGVQLQWRPESFASGNSSLMSNLYSTASSRLSLSAGCNG